MLITFKTITQQTFKLEFAEADTVVDIKKKISEEKGDKDFAVDAQKLIYNGKILEDQQTLQELNIDEKKFVVVMVSRKKAAEPTSSSASTKTATSESKSDAAAPAAKPAEEKKAADTTQPAQAAALTPSEVPQEHQQTVEAIQAMGYPRDEVVRALRASFFNADRAVEYLCSGIPDIDINDQSGAAPVAGEQGGDSDADEAEAQGLDFLQSSPQFQQLRDLVRTDPAILPQIVQQIAESNPQLMNAIRDNQEEFLQLLNTDAAGAGEADAGAATGGAAAAGGPGAPQQPGVVTIAVTENDRNAIQRLKALGFPEQLIIEAYFACDKNEDLAVNYILARLDEIHDNDGN
ncbi:UBA/TS-N domain-containing protein [Ditylenchus destructor]|nr:UBA/TS-N domain-containing protein [Ditylenchus destructor]